MPSRRAFAFLAATLLGASIPTLAAAEVQRWTVETGKGRVGFDAFHRLGNFSASTEAATGEVELDITDLKQPVQGSLTVPGASFRSGKSGRDKDILRALDVERHPEIRYRIQKLESSFPSLAENTDVILTMHGVLSMHGADRAVTFSGRLRLRQGSLWVRGESFIRPRDWGVPLLRDWLLAMRDSVLATFDLVLNKAQ